MQIYKNAIKKSGGSFFKIVQYEWGFFLKKCGDKNGDIWRCSGDLQSKTFGHTASKYI